VPRLRQWMIRQRHPTRLPGCFCWHQYPHQSTNCMVEKPFGTHESTDNPDYNINSLLAKVRQPTPNMLSAALAKPHSVISQNVTTAMHTSSCTCMPYTPDVLHSDSHRLRQYSQNVSAAPNMYVESPSAHTIISPS
jgi:hypothetical protein